MGKFFAHLRNQWMGALALFLVLAGGTAWAATELDKNEVKSKHIGKGQVKTKDLARDAVTSPKVANGSLLGEDFAAGQLPQGPRGPQGPQGEQGAAGATDVTVRSAATIGDFLVRVDCLDGERAVGGGVEAGGEDYVRVTKPHPETGTPTGWVGAVADRAGGFTSAGKVYAICASP